MSKAFSVEEIKELMKSMSEHRLGEFSYECEGVKLKLKNAAVQTVAAQSIPMPLQVSAAASAPVSQPEAAPAASEGTFITSPIVGTFYCAASPDKEPFVTNGQKINKGDVIFIIESMKVMNEVPSDLSGTVAEILVENGQPVEFGQNILRLE